MFKMFKINVRSKWGIHKSQEKIARDIFVNENRSAKSDDGYIKCCHEQTEYCVLSHGRN